MIGNEAQKKAHNIYTLMTFEQTEERDATAPDTTRHDDTLIIIFNCHLVDGIHQPNSLTQMSLLIQAKIQNHLCM